MNIPNTFNSFYPWLLGALAALGVLSPIIVTLLSRNIALTLAKINDNQDNLAKMLNEKMKNIEEKQDRLEIAHERLDEEHKETRKELDNLLGQHKVFVELGHGKV